MLKKELPLKHIKINYDPIIDTPLEIKRNIQIYMNKKLQKTVLIRLFMITIYRIM